MVDQISESNLELKENDKYDFSFDKPLPLVIGQENEYTILVQLDEEQSEPHYSVKNLSFQTVKRVVLEEGTDRIVRTVRKAFWPLKIWKMFTATCSSL